MFAVELKNGLYCFPLDNITPKEIKVTFEASNIQLELWHRKLAHICSDLIINACRQNGVRFFFYIKEQWFSL